MNAIENIIFNELASRRKVTLPGVGTLYVAFQSAKLEKKGSLKQPINRVEFSKKEDPTAQSIIVALEKTGLSKDEAQLQYQTWVEQARRGSTLIIDGVGELKNGFFKISPELHEVINPLLANQHIKQHYGSKKKDIIAFFVFLVGLVVIGMIWWHDHKEDNYTPEGVAKDNSVYVEEDSLEKAAFNAAIAAVGSTEVFIEKNTIGEISADTVLSNPDHIAQNDMPSSAMVESSSSTSSIHSGPTYYVVAGVFSTEENADRYISSTLKRFPNLRLAKVAFPGNKIMVSLFSAQSSEEASLARKRISRETNNGDLWIHKSK